MLRFLSSILPIFLLLSIHVASMSVPRSVVTANVGEKIEIPFSNATTITRYVYNAKNVQQQQVFRVCNGKNKKTFGYWENTKTKKRVARVTNYNKKKGMMIIPKATQADGGAYHGPYYHIIDVFVF